MRRHGGIIRPSEGTSTRRENVPSFVDLLADQMCRREIDVGNGPPGRDLE
jgi:hypothetical protein